MRRISSAVCSGRHSKRSAEQRWPALLNADVSASRTTCSGSAELSTIIALTPPVSAISVASGPSRAASAELIARAVSTEPVNATPATRASPSSASPSARPSPGRNCSAPAGMPALLEQRDGARRDERALLGRLRDDGVAGRERRGDLPREDREREIPRAHAEEHAAADRARARCARRSAPAAASAPRARARTRPRSSATDRRPRGPRRGCRARSCPSRRRSARRARRGRPRRARPRARAAPRAASAGVSFQRGANALAASSARRAVRGIGEFGDADDAPPVGGVAAFLRGAGDVLAVDARPRAPAADVGRAERRGELLELAARSEIRAARVLALGREQVARQRDARMPRGGAEAARDVDGIRDDLVDAAPRPARAGSRTRCSRRSRAGAARGTAAGARGCRRARRRGSGARTRAARGARRRAPRPCRAGAAARTVCRRRPRAATRPCARCASRTADTANRAAPAAPSRTRDTRRRCCTCA